MSRLILVLGDQLSLSLSSLRQRVDGDCVLMAEVQQEAGYVPHHQLKIVLLFSAMRHFAAALRLQQMDVHYIDYQQKVQSLLDAIKQVLTKRPDISEVVLTESGEYRLQQDIHSWSSQLGLAVTVLPDDRFICSRAQFAQWASGRKQYRMEFFYREMRRYTGLLMDGDQPVGGQWNFDADNRQSLPADLAVPAPFSVVPDAITTEVIQLVASEF